MIEYEQRGVERDLFTDIENGHLELDKIKNEMWTS